MMGSGKTTLGQQLAESLQLPFVDLDEYIEHRQGKTIAQLFEQVSPGKFREVERQALEAVTSEFTDAVIATGGGTPCFFDNIAFINNHGTSIFLDVPQEEIFKRLHATDLASRPLLAGKSDEELKRFIINTLEQRQDFYKQATYTLYGEYSILSDLLMLLNHK